MSFIPEILQIILKLQANEAEQQAIANADTIARQAQSKADVMDHILT